MKKYILGVLAVMLTTNMAQALEKQLPQPDKSGGLPLMEALQQRRSGKFFIKKDIDDKVLSNILWAAYGVNDNEGRRTIPTAMNQKELEIYIADKNGVWVYDADNNALQQISDENILKAFSSQEYMENAPLVLIYTGNKESNYVEMHAGSAYQNVGLYAASAGLNNVVRGYFDKEQVAKLIKLPENKKVIITQAIGWGK
ncbi:MAG: SagB/ThcOx family dehydrogenase [Alphaproteobacteria bacterium]|nr:SagB/ThcOx family dehydrogenase [Alphaproteobacteria bacterium]